MATKKKHRKQMERIAADMNDMPNVNHVKEMKRRFKAKGVAGIKEYINIVDKYSFSLQGKEKSNDAK